MDAVLVLTFCVGGVALAAAGANRLLRSPIPALARFVQVLAAIFVAGLAYDLLTTGWVGRTWEYVKSMWGKIREIGFSAPDVSGIESPVVIGVLLLIAATALFLYPKIRTGTVGARPKGIVRISTGTILAGIGLLFLWTTLHVNLGPVTAINLLIVGVAFFVALWVIGAIVGNDRFVQVVKIGSVLAAVALFLGWYTDSIPLSAPGGATTRQVVSAPRPVVLPGEFTAVVPAYGRSQPIDVPVGKKLDPVAMPGGVTFHVVFADGTTCIAWQTCEKDGPHHYKNGHIAYVYIENEESRAAAVRYRFIPMT